MDTRLKLIDHFQKTFSGKWKLPLLFLISINCNRFSTIHKNLPGITKQMLSQQLKELESDGLILRESFAEIPPRVEYTLTPLAKTISPIISEIIKWSDSQLEKPTPLTLF